MIKVLLDTNFLMGLMRFRVGLKEIDTLVTEPRQLVTINLVVNELKRLAKTSKYAKMALKLIELYKIKVLNSTETNTDKAIIKLAEKDFIVATNDIALRRRLKRLGVKTIYLRARKHLAIS